MTTDLYLPCRHSWFLRIIGRVPTLPRTGDRGPVMDALNEVVDPLRSFGEACRVELKSMRAGM
jgi:hypothetical protein